MFDRNQGWFQEYLIGGSNFFRVYLNKSPYLLYVFRTDMPEKPVYTQIRWRRTLRLIRVYIISHPYSYFGLIYRK